MERKVVFLPRPDTSLVDSLRVDEPALMTVPEGYQKYFGKREQEKKLHVADVKFFEGLLDKYGLSEGSRNDDANSRKFGRVEFFSAAVDLKGYAMELRTKDTDHHLVDYNYYSSSGQRMRDLTTMFFHQPKIKKEYMQVHAEKMELALPDFIEGLSLPEMARSTTRANYFGKVDNLMGETLTSASQSFDDADVCNVGLLIGYNTRGLYQTEGSSRSYFAEMGYGTFLNFLREVVDETVYARADLPSAIRREFLERDGLGYNLMRMHLSDFIGNEAAVAHRSLNGRRVMLQESDHNIGACPAILKTTSPEDQRQRPIAYEYAAAIVRRMPKALSSLEF